MKEMTSVAAAMMTDEEKAEAEKQMNAGNSNGTPQSVTSTPHVDPETGPTNGPSGSHEHPLTDKAEEPHEQKKRPKLTPEQKKKLEEVQVQRRKAMEERVNVLTTQLIERLRPFVQAQGPDRDSEIENFRKNIVKEAEDLKLESFGTEVCLSFTLFGYLLIGVRP